MDDFLYRVSRRVKDSVDEWEPVSKRTGGIPRAYSSVGIARGARTYLENAEKERLRFGRHTLPEYEFRVEKMPQVEWEPVPNHGN